MIRSGSAPGHVAALRQRDALVEAEQVGVVRVLVLDHDRDVVERRGKVGRQRVERCLDVVVEGHEIMVSG